jgi:hypothetical protein
MGVAIGAALWFIASIPIGMVIGRAMARNNIRSFGIPKYKATILHGDGTIEEVVLRSEDGR